MTKKLLLILSCLFLCTTAALAQGKQYVGYCDGQIASTSSGKYTSIGEVGATVSIAIRLTKESLAAYKGCDIVGVNYGSPTSQGLPSVSVWIRSSLDGADLTSGKITSTNYGWHEGAVAPYTITGNESELWIGATYKNNTRAYYAVSFAGTTVADGCYVNAGSAWTNYATQGWGSLSLEAIVEGSGVKSRDLALQNVTCSQRAVQIGQDFSVSGLIKNNASDPAVNPLIRYSLGGKALGTYTYDGTISSRTSAPFTINIPSESVTEEGPATVELSLEWADGQPDQAPADNVASLQVEMTRLSFTRRMVVEEHTGSWCGWCVRGIVGLKEMKEKFGDDFIGIGIHNNDMYAVQAYDDFIAGYMNGYPNSIINRSGSQADPAYTTLFSRYQSMDKTADADITLDASCADGKITFNAHAQFVFSAKNADYRVAFVLLENQLPIRQTNNYAGGGTVMGGFESMGSPANINIDDVARGIYPSPAGEKGALPASIAASTIYDYSYTTALPKLSKPANVEAVALLLNGTTGEILNAVKISKIEGLNAGDIDDPDTPDAELSCTLSPAAGATVNTLDKVVLTFHGKDAEAGMNHVGYYNYLAPNYGAPSVQISSRPYLKADDGKTVAKASRVMWTKNPDYGKVAGADPYNVCEFQLSFDGVPAGHYTLVVPQNSFVYYNSRDVLCTTPEYTADYTVTTSSPALLGHYDASFQPARNSELEQWDVVTLNSNDAIFDYLHTDLPLVYNYFYIDTPRRPYVILPNGVEQEAKYVDFVETTGVSTVGTQIQFTFSPSRTRGTYTLVIPDGYIVQGNDATEEAYAQPERRFNFFVGQAPEGIEKTTDDGQQTPCAYGTKVAGRACDLTGRPLINPAGLYIRQGRKLMK